MIKPNTKYISNILILVICDTVICSLLQSAISSSKCVKQGKWNVQHHLTIEINNCIGRPCPNSSDCKFGVDSIHQLDSSTSQRRWHWLLTTACRLWKKLSQTKKLVVGDQYPHFSGSKNMLQHNIFAPSSYPHPMDVAQQQMLIFGSRNYGPTEPQVRRCFMFCFYCHKRHLMAHSGSRIC